jgi:ParB family chromosome partitioning protein
VIAGTLEMGHARALATLPKDRQIMLAEKIAINDLSVRATEALVKEESGAAGNGKRPGVPTAKSKQGKLDLPVTRDPDLDRLETELADALGTYVSIAHQTGGQGELVIRYASLDQLDGLIARMKR